MNRFLLKNDTVDNVSARLTVTPSGELSNLGQAGATVIEGNKLTTCLAPTTVTIKEPEAFKSDVIELSEDNKYVVEVNGVVVPFIFTPDQLPLYFDGSEARPSIQFKEYVKPEIACLPTSIPNTFPEFHMFATRKPYVLTAVIIEAGVTRTQKVTLDHTNSNFQGSEATIFKQMLGALGLSKLGTPGVSGTPVYELVAIQPQNIEEVGKILGFGYGNVEEPWYNVIEGGDNPVNISFLPTTSPGTATDLYSFINTTDVVHSCGWAETGGAVEVFTDEDTYFRPAFITIEDVT
mgnify:CR=1 FL=1